MYLPTAIVMCYFFPPGSVVSSAGDILSLQPVPSQAKLAKRVSRGELPSGSLRAALGIWPCAVAYSGSMYLQSNMLNLPSKMEIDNQAIGGDGEFGGGLFMCFGPPSTCIFPPAVNFQLGPFLNSVSE